jgi:hypothetical protein
MLDQLGKNSTDGVTTKLVPLQIGYFFERV